MIEENLKKTVEEFSEIVKCIESLEILEEEHISRLKAKLNLFDGTNLWIREMAVRGKLEIYSYYWLRPDGSVIIGWDNAPHHKELNHYPHHKHIGHKVETSQEREVREVLEFIKKFLG